jgi:hypothetical protein
MNEDTRSSKPRDQKAQRDFSSFTMASCMSTVHVRRSCPPFMSDVSAHPPSAPTAGRQRISASRCARPRGLDQAEGPLLDPSPCIGHRGQPCTPDTTFWSKSDSPLPCRVQEALFQGRGGRTEYHPRWHGSGRPTGARPHQGAACPLHAFHPRPKTSRPDTAGCLPSRDNRLIVSYC